MEITTNQLSLTGVIMENPQFDHEVFGEAFFRTVLSVPRLSGALVTLFTVGFDAYVVIGGIFSACRAVRCCQIGRAHV